MAIPKRVSELIEKRSGGVCEGCGHRPAVEKHHRKYKSRGGKDEVVNLLHLCGWGNHTGCHGVAHSTRGHELGWSVNSWADPADVAVTFADGIDRELKPDGSRVPA